MLIDGTTHGIGVQLHRKEFERSRLLKWYIANAEVEVRDEIKGTHIVGHREAGRLLRSDLEMSGWVRLTEDFRRPGRDGGEADVCEGWVSLNANDVTRWRPPAEAKGAPPESLPGKTHHFWVAPRAGVAVRDKPWGSVLTKREHGELLRGDQIVDGWLRLEEDFVRTPTTSGAGGTRRGKGGPLAEAVGEDVAGQCVWAEELEADDDGISTPPPLLRGWVLIDGRDFGLPCQLQARDSERRERSIPKPSVTQAGGGKVYISWELAEEVAENLAAKFRRRRAQAEAERAEDWSVEAVVAQAGAGESSADVLRRCGVADVHDLLRVTAGGEAQDELKNVGVSRLGARSKLAKHLQPYWEGQLAKERANASYKLGQYDDAIAAYTRALAAMPCHSTLLALNLYNNRAAAYQQRGLHTDALRDALFVLRYDAANTKALVRADRARANGAQTQAEMDDADAARAEAAAAAAAQAEDAEIVAQAAAQGIETTDAPAVAAVDPPQVDISEAGAPAESQ